MDALMNVFTNIATEIILIVLPWSSFKKFSDFVFDFSIFFNDLFENSTEVFFGNSLENH